MMKYEKNHIDYLRKISEGRSSKDITKMFNEKFNTNLSEKAVTSTRKRYGILTGRTGRFIKGNIPFNKGKKYPGMINKTIFKKGQESLTKKPVGSERICKKDGYIWIKIKDPNIYVHKHKYLYEKEHGKIKKGQIVVFLDQNKMNLSLDNLACIDRNTHLIMNRNSWYSSDPKITKSRLSVAKLKSKIYKVKNKLSERGKNYNNFS